MALLVTGAMGHCGYETVKLAAREDMTVVAQYLNTYRAADAEAVGDGVTWVRCDLSDPFEVAALAATQQIESCIHTAAIPNDKMAFPVPMRTFKSNVAATQNLLELARRQSWRRFILVSTGAVFQRWEDTTKPIPEDTAPSPATLYGTTKHCAELMTSIYAGTYGLSAATIRISWVYGPPLVPKSFDGPRGPIPEFLKRVMRGEAVNQPSGGDFTASFTYVTDVARGLLAASRADILNHAIYHLGSGENYPTLRVAEAIRRAVPEAEIGLGAGYEPWIQFTVRRGPLQCERMKTDFGFQLAYTLESAIAEFAEWMRAKPESYAH